MRLQASFILFFCLLFFQNSQAHTVMLKDVQGQKIPFNSLRGKWVFINYWADWCQPCVDEIRELNRFYKDKKAEVALFAVNYDQLPLSQQLALIKKYRIQYPSLRIDPAPDLLLEDIPGIPATFVFNPEGKLSKVLYGGQTFAKLHSVMHSLAKNEGKRL